jgi:hypothetical protein
MSAKLGLGVGAGEMIVVDRINSEGAHVASTLPLRDYLPGASSPETAIWAPAVSLALAQAKGLSGDLQVSVSDDWVRYWTVTPPRGLGSLAELRALAVARFEQLFGRDASTWHIEADWRADQTMLACALPKSLIEALNNMSAEASCRIASVVPEAVRLINREASAISADCWLCSFSSHAFLAILLEAGRIRAARQFHFDLQPDITEVLARLETESLRMGVEMPQQVLLLGDAPVVGELPVTSDLDVRTLGRRRALPKPLGIEQASEAYRLALLGVMA